MERVVTDMYGNELKVGDNVCFTISMRKDDKPIVKAKVGGFICGKTTDWIVIDEYVESSSVEWGRLENKLIKKVSTSRVVKCY